MENEIDRGTIESFLLAGNCTFIIYQDGTEKTPVVKKKYKLKLKEKGGNGYYLYTTENNGNSMKYHGFLIKGDRSWFYYPGKKVVGTSKYNNANVKGLLWVLNHLDRLPSAVHILHTGKCSRCGRTLTDPESMKYGMGPECRRKSKIK